MHQPYKYQLWKQQSISGSAPVYLQVIDIILLEGERHRLRLMNLNDITQVKEISPADFSLLVEKKVLIEWKAGG